MTVDRSDLVWRKSLRLNLSYLDNWPVAGDLLLIARTLGAVAASDGAFW
jgi:lipopolysaccharide/colanic/teichoic acid biosynthesis glycosyltransferase